MDFSYFDQFGNIEIDLTGYLANLNTCFTSPTSGFVYSFSNNQPVITTVSNLFTKYDIIFDYTKNIELILRYDIRDNEFPETVSFKTYGSTDYWWIVYVFNNITEPFKQWPFTQNQIVNLANKLYNEERLYSYQTYLDYLIEINEEKRHIILPKPDTVKDIIWKYRQAILNG